jgi:hypothetical protein
MANELHEGTILRDGDREYVVCGAVPSFTDFHAITVVLRLQYPARAFDIGDVLANGKLWGVVQSYTFNESKWLWDYTVRLDGGILCVWCEPKARLLSDAAKAVKP